MKNALAIIGIAATTFVGGFLTSGYYYHTEVIPVKEAAAFAKGTANLDFQKNSESLNAVCKKWWFGLSHVQRKLNIPRKTK